MTDPTILEDKPVLDLRPGILESLSVPLEVVSLAAARQRVRKGLAVEGGPQGTILLLSRSVTVGIAQPAQATLTAVDMCVSASRRDVLGFIASQDSDGQGVVFLPSFVRIVDHAESALRNARRHLTYRTGTVGGDDDDLFDQAQSFLLEWDQRTRNDLEHVKRFGAALRSRMQTNNLARKRGKV